MSLFSGWAFWLWTVPTLFMAAWTFLAYFALLLGALGVDSFLLTMLFLCHPGRVPLMLFGLDGLEMTPGGFLFFLVLGAIPVFNIVLPLGAILLYWTHGLARYK